MQYECHMCGRMIPQGAHYEVRIEIFADPSMPPMTSDEVEAIDPQAMAKLIEQMKDMTGQELQDQVYRKFEFQLCRPCQIEFLVNPLGKPRQRKVGKN
jgi:hypothetical protein